MSQDNEDNNNKNYKTVTSSSVTEYTDRREYSVSYDNGTTDRHVESKVFHTASRYSRLTDFTVNAKLGDKKEINNNKETED